MSDVGRLLDEAEQLLGHDPGQALARFSSILKTPLKTPLPKGSDDWTRASLGSCLAARRSGAVDVARRQLKSLDEALLATPKTEPVPEVAVRALLVVADLHSEDGEVGTAEQCLRHAAALARESTPTLLAGSCFHRLGALFAVADRFDDAEKFYDAALDTVAAVSGDDDPAIGALLDELASVYGRAGRQAQAEAALVEAAAQLATSVPRDASLQAHVLLRLGTARLGADVERRTQGMLHLHEAHTLLRGLLGDQHPMLAVVVDKIAAGHLLAGERDEAEAFARRALKLAKNAERPDPRALASSLTTLAAVASLRGQREEARAFATEALKAIAGVDDVAGRQALEQNLARLA